ncbi:MAG TPA: phospholipase D-like domain-containing protein [Anaerolineaceae bacterium]|nr:phospholipase D-like domain-containing protein [Anaerolineaceae bacterium]
MSPSSKRTASKAASSHSKTARDSSRRLQALSILLALLMILALVILYLYFEKNGWPSLQTSTTPQADIQTSEPGGEFTKTPRPTITPTPSGPEPTPIALNGSYKPLTWLTLYFTNPKDPNVTSNGIDQVVVAEIGNAKTSIDVASFDLNLPSISEALVSAQKRGVIVRVVVDGVNGSTTLKASDTADNKAYDALKAMKAAKIPVVNGGRSSGLMHDKLVIIDSKVLYMGSWNLSYNDTFRNNNNLLRITNPVLISNYQAKFDEMFVTRKFGTRSKVGAKEPDFKIGTIRVQNYFSPRDKVMEKLVGLVSGAKKSVHFYAFTYTHVDLSNAMIERAKAGVDVQGVIEDRGASQGALPALFCAKLKVNTDGNKNTMHHKVIIIDGEIVITGSFNFTQSADKSNDDNVLIIYSKSVANVYEDEFKRIMQESNTPDSVTCP